MRAGNYAAYISTAGGTARTGSLYGTGPRGRSGVSVTVPSSEVRPGQWFTIELDCIGPKMTVLVDGKQTAQHNDRTFPRGAIGLELLETGTTLRIRRLQVQEVKIRG